ncbi:MAG: hypothetical protein ACJARW_000911 [Methylophilaceae bacterium]|jgi:hypothetical protein|tara:strand:+ start:24099 stop:24296 length:198 start_codon:yes stop_codon:yes gene_type:complete
MEKHCKKFVLINAQEKDKKASNQYTYHIKPNREVTNHELIQALKANNFAQKITVSEELETSEGFT